MDVSNSALIYKYSIKTLDDTKVGNDKKVDPSDLVLSAEITEHFPGGADPTLFKVHLEIKKPDGPIVCTFVSDVKHYVTDNLHNLQTSLQLNEDKTELYFDSFELTSNVYYDANVSVIFNDTFQFNEAVIYSKDKDTRTFLCNIDTQPQYDPINDVIRIQLQNEILDKPLLFFHPQHRTFALKTNDITVADGNISANVDIVSLNNNLLLLNFILFNTNDSQIQSVDHSPSVYDTIIITFINVPRSKFYTIKCQNQNEFQIVGTTYVT